MNGFENRFLPPFQRIINILLKRAVLGFEYLRKPKTQNRFSKPVETEKTGFGTMKTGFENHDNFLQDNELCTVLRN